MPSNSEVPAPQAQRRNSLHPVMGRRRGVVGPTGRFCSVAEAARATGEPEKTIWTRCNRRYGRWRFADDPQMVQAQGLRP